MRSIQIRPEDNVAVLLEGSGGIPQGHKIAVRDISAGEPVIKYGYPIGHALCNIRKGEHVHTHNCATNLSRKIEYSYHPSFVEPEPAAPVFFQGYRRPDGRAATRNEIWILPTVGCVNGTAEKLARDNQSLVNGSLEGIYAFPHPYGCSQLGDDHKNTRRILAALARHPNAAGVLVVGLGCENLTIEQFKEELGVYDENRVRFLICQQSEDEYSEGAELLSELADTAKTFRREPVPISELTVGLKCGGSDGLSGITANPAAGVFSDLLIVSGGTAILTEVPEMFGAETILMDRCVSEAVFQKTVSMINRYKDYYTAHGEPVYENPSPGNKEGGITTLEDKSLGCVQKGGTSPVTDVIGYGETVTKKGLQLLYGPGNDLVSSTALTAAGAQIILFTTGRGTPFGAPVPTVKIATNTALFEKKNNWIDFKAGPAAEGEALTDTGKRLFDAVIEIANGKKTAAEKNGFHSIAIFKNGVTL